MTAQSTLALPEYAITHNSIHHMDLFALCNAMGDASVDMILCDLPYGSTACTWDTVIPMAPMWEQFKRIIKPKGAIVLTASQPFTSVLVTSNLKMFKHDIIWHKTQATGHLNCRVEPMREHEEILVFAHGKVNYYPQITLKKPENIRPVLPRVNSDVYGVFNNDSPRSISAEFTYPRSVVDIPNPNHNEAGLHPTQKPVALFEYLIRTYTREGDLVFDPCVGSGTTAVSARNTGRDYICGDFTREYVELARDRVRNSDPFQASVDRKTGIKQLSLFEAY